MSEPEEDEYTVPLQDQRVWGAGIKRKRVAFVPARSSTESARGTETDTNAESASSRYLSIVLKNKAADTQAPPTFSNPAPRNEADHAHSDTHTAESVPRALRADDSDAKLCPICKAPLQDEPEVPGTDPDTVSESAESGAQRPRRHEASLAHQVCLTHVHPPSAIDRSRTGAKYLASYGWDPDARLGLGAKGEGVLAPVKGRIKNDTVGLGVEAEMSARKEKKVLGGRVGGTSGERGQGRDFKMGAGQVREQRAREKVETERLRNIIFGDDKLAKYLGEGV